MEAREGVLSEIGHRAHLGVCPICLFGVYQSEPVSTYEEQVPALKAGPLVMQPLEALLPGQVEELTAELI